MDSIQTVVATGALPDEFAPYLSALIDGDETHFIAQEGINWDFKPEWPFSYSDSYFGGIARLACAFANTKGGIIVFGVHDKNRTGGHNKVPPNLDKLQKALAQILTRAPHLNVRRYQTTAGDVDLLLVSPIQSDQMPTRFAKPLDKYKENIIWVRDGHEVRQAEPKNVSALYCRVAPPEGELDDLSLTRPLPPSHATVKTFVGRMSTIDAISS